MVIHCGRNIFKPANFSLIEKNNPRHAAESDEAFDRRIRSQYVDSCRFLLPAASLANVGMTANARVLEHAICKMLSHPLSEVRQIGEEVKQVTQTEVPTLVKYADAVPYLVETSRGLEQGNTHQVELDLRQRKDDWCRLIDFDPCGENKVLAASLYRLKNSKTWQDNFWGASVSMMCLCENWNTQLIHLTSCLIRAVMSN
jgi:thymidylate synthase ThyX